MTNLAASGRGIKNLGNRTRFLTNDEIYSVTIFKAVRTPLR